MSTQYYPVAIVIVTELFPQKKTTNVPPPEKFRQTPTLIIEKS